VLKAGKTEKWKLTCENPKSGKVLQTRRITVDRGQKLVLDLSCGRKRKGGGGHHRQHKHGQGEE
jgi:hypothetical protein